MELNQNYQNRNNIKFEGNKYLQKEELFHNQINGNLFSSNGFANNNQEKKFDHKGNNSGNINDNDLFSKKENLYNTANNFYIKDYLNMDKAANLPNNKNPYNNNINSYATNDFYNNFKNKFLSDKKAKSEIDFKYNYYLSNLNKERNNNNQDSQKYNDNMIKENEQIQKLLVEEKNIEDENLKRLTELRFKYLSSIKTFEVPDLPKDKDDTKSLRNKCNKTNKSILDSELSGIFNKTNFVKTERIDIQKTNELNQLNRNINPKYNKNKSFSHGGELWKQSYSTNEIVKSPSSITHKKNIIENQNKINVNENNLNEGNNEVQPNVENNENNYEIPKELSENKNLVNISLNDKMNKKEISGENSILNSMSEVFSNKNFSQIFDNQMNINNETDINIKYDDSLEEKHKRIGKNNSSNIINSQKYYNILNNDENNQSKKEVNKNSELNEINLFNKNKIENINNYNKIINELIQNYKNLENDYNKIQFEYNLLKKEYFDLLNEYNKIKDNQNLEDKKNLFSQYITKENNELRSLNSNYEYILTPLINYINDINTFLNNKNLKRIDLVKLKKNLKKVNYEQNSNSNNFDDHPLKPFNLLLENYKNIIINDKNITIKKSQSNPKKIYSFESIMKDYNIKEDVYLFKPSNKINKKNSKSMTDTPIISKNVKTHKYLGKENNIAKTEKVHIKSRTKIPERKKSNLDKFKKKDISLCKKKKIK